MSNGVLDWERPDTHTAMLDRSPCGSGTAAVMTLLHSRGELGLGEEFTHSSVLGTQFRGSLLTTGTVAGRAAVLPSISGRAWITSTSQQLVQQDDPLPAGFTVSDIWS